MPKNAWIVVLKALQKLPYEESAEIINYIQQQVYIQDQPPKASDTTKKIIPKTESKKN